MDWSVGPLYSSIPGPLDYVYLWEESYFHIPIANHACLVSNGSEFIEIPWYSQSYVMYAGPGSPDPLPPAQPVVPVDLATPAGGSGSLEEHRRVAVVQLSPSPQSSRPPSHRPSRASSRVSSGVSSGASSGRPSTPPITRRTPPSSTFTPSPVSIRSSTLSSVSTRTSNTSLTDEQARQTLETWIERSEWFQNDELEPEVGAPGVPTCALQLAEKGQSIYCCFLIVAKGRGGKVIGWKSVTDPSGWDRLHRAIAKERARRGHRPFKCPQRHGNCSFKGPSQESLSDHLSARNISVPCHVCSRPIASKNMQRHLRDMHML